MIQNKRGISLIILIITIIVMIILATVIIISLTDSGIIDKAKEAKSKMNLKSMEEAAKTAFSEVALDKKDTKYINGNDLINKMMENGITEEQLEDYYILCSDGEVIVEDVKRLELTEKAATDADLKCEYNTENTTLDYYTSSNNCDTIIVPYKIGTQTFNNTLVSIDFTFQDELPKIKKTYVSYGIEKLNFSWCSEKVFLPQSINEIAEGMFADSALVAVTIPNSVTTIGDAAFRQCTSLKSITIPDNVTTIGDDAFDQCTSLEHVTIPDNVTTIGNFAFGQCTSLKSIIIPKNITGYEEFRFANSGLVDIVFKEGMLKIPENICMECHKLKNVTLPSTTTTIGDAAFSQCESLEYVTIPDNVTTIGDFAFGQCTSLKHITIPSSVITVGYGIFSGCENITVNVSWKEGNKPSGWDYYWTDESNVTINYAK